MSEKSRDKADYYFEQIDRLHNLPTIPVIAADLLRVIADDKASVNQLLPIIEKDPSLVLKILRVANSAYYGVPQKVDSLQQAVVLIGLADLTNLVLGFSIIKSFMNYTEDSTWLDWKEFWQHSVSVGYIAQYIKSEFRLPMAGSPYSLGLLHDVGKLVLYQIAPNEFQKVANLVKKDGTPSPLAEMEIFGLDHAKSGSLLAQRWDLPSSIIETIAKHHIGTEEDSDFRALCALIGTADYLSHRLNRGFISSVPEEIEDASSSWDELCICFPQMAGVDKDDLVALIQDTMPPLNELMAVTRN